MTIPVNTIYPVILLRLFPYGTFFQKGGASQELLYLQQSLRSSKLLDDPSDVKRGRKLSFHLIELRNHCGC